MCGIAGIAGRRDEALVREMAQRLAHRGPDGEGFYAGDDVTLGHRRLSIIDLEAGKQPLSNEDGSIWITFNGEIYNYRELRAELEAKGHVFRTQSDTESIVHAYEEYGEECVRKLYGMFAFGIWDTRDRSLFLARDHAGVKPLYYAESAGALLFASEMKAILVAPAIARELDVYALDEYLSYLYTVPPRTIFKAIRQLPPAHILRWKDGRLSMKRYWRPVFGEEDHREEEWAERIRACLEEVIRGNMIADVPLGAFLSGGLDSGTIVAMMSRAAAEPVRTFTIGFGGEGGRYDETEEAETLARFFHTDHHMMRANADVAGLLPGVARHFDEPFGNPTAFLVYVLSKLIREHVTVALAGDGGDESFGGYARYAGAAWSRQFRRIPAMVRRGAINPLVSMLPESTHGLHALRRIREFSAGSLLEPVDMYASWQTYMGPEQRARLYTGDLWRELGDHDPRDFLRGLFAECAGADFVSQCMYADLLSFLPHNVLHYSDRMSMAHALEVRVPFTDPRVIELLAKVPSRLKVRGFETKHIMRQAMRPLLPPDAIARKKLGFNPPMGVWLNTELREMAEDCLSEETIRRRGYFHPAPVRAMLAAHQASRRDYTWSLWALVMFEQWHRMYLDAAGG